MSYTPPFVSELPDHPVTGCVPASGLMLANKITHGAFPSSVAEREALQTRMGTQTSGADTDQLAAGMRSLFSLQLVPGAGWDGILTRLTDPARGVVILGAYQSLPGDIRAHGSQSTFAGIHAMYAQGDGAGSVTLGDPLASSYLRRVAVDDLEAFCAGWGYSFLSGKEQAQPAGYLADIGPGVVTAYDVVRFTHLLVGPKATSWPRASHCQVAHGAPGFWRALDGYYRGKYLRAGKSGPFAIRQLLSDGSSQPVDPRT